MSDLYFEKRTLLRVSKEEVDAIIEAAQEMMGEDYEVEGLEDALLILSLDVEGFPHLKEASEIEEITDTDSLLRWRGQ